MPRPAPGLASVAADLARHLAGERPAWITVATWRRLRGAAQALRDDAAALLARDGVVAAAETLGVARSTLDRWRAGWLRAPQGSKTTPRDAARGETTMDTRIWTERGESEARNDLRAGSLPRAEAEIADAQGELIAHVELHDDGENAREIERAARRYLDGAEADEAVRADLAAAREAVAAGYRDEVRRIWSQR